MLRTQNIFVHCSSHGAYRRDLDSVNSKLQPYGLPNLSNVLLLQMILYDEKRLSVDSNSETPKAFLGYIYATKRFQ